MNCLNSSLRFWSKLRIAANENWKLFVIKPVLILYMLQYSIGSTVNDQVRKIFVTITITRFEIYPSLKLRPDILTFFFILVMARENMFGYSWIQ